MSYDEFFDVIDRNRREYFREKYHARAYPENRELRIAQLSILERSLDGEGIDIFEGACGEGVLSLLAIYSEIIKKATLADNNPNVLELTKNT